MTPYYEEAGIVVFHGDCREVLPTLCDIDLVFFDPPYGVGVADWDLRFDTTDVAHTCLWMLRDGGSLYATCSAHILPQMMAALPYRRIISWGKPNLPMRKYLNEWEWSTEFVLWVTRGSFVFNKPYGEDGRDYWRIPVENGFLNPDMQGHPARKPIRLLSLILQASTNTGAVVLDPFLGSGTTLQAAKALGRRAIGIDIDERHCEMAVKRLAQGAFDFSESAGVK